MSRLAGAESKVWPFYQAASSIPSLAATAQHAELMLLCSDLCCSGGKAKGHAMRAAINTPIQGSAADIATAAMLTIAGNARLKELDWKLLLQVLHPVQCFWAFACMQTVLSSEQVS